MRSIKSLVLVTLVLSLIISLLTGCSNSASPTSGSQSTTTAGEASKATTTSTETAQVTTAKPTQEINLAGFKAYLSDNGFTVGENEVMSFGAAFATDGMTFKVNGKNIGEMYYNPSKLEDGAEKLLEDATRGSVSISGMNVPVYRVGDYVITLLYNHPDAEAIKKAASAYFG